MTNITQPNNFRELVACTQYARKISYRREDYNVSRLFFQLPDVLP